MMTFNGKKGDSDETLGGTYGQPEPFGHGMDSRGRCLTLLYVRLDDLWGCASTLQFYEHVGKGPPI